MLTTRYVTGAPNWIDLGTPDIEGAGAFYHHLFGWRFQAGPESGGYGFFQLDGRTVAAGMQNPPEQGPPSWNVYFQTSDADATAKAVEQAHGSVLIRPMDVMDQGRMAVLGDRAGVPFSIWQPQRNRGLDVITVPGSLCWLELYTPDLPAAAGFYNAVFGWETSAITFDGGSYTCVNPARTEQKDMFAGIVPLDEDPVEAESGPYWLPYFEVTDTDEVVNRAREHGGSVRVPATDMAGVGRFAKLADPYGARFAVIRSESPQG
ncbi:VOC family protein [Streptomyces capitiformicae]|uniref:Hydroxylase n=1 Tax=Streptomyces capitiformicae TaxID=2014920 RepID=A0A918ZFM6_9ACTN|nr:VOC family protein [Streptomyces capitiformicae]GHE48880.1 hydroxylase [Streptomyces capitiformicae]